MANSAKKGKLQKKEGKRPLSKKQRKQNEREKKAERMRARGDSYIRADTHSVN